MRSQEAARAIPELVAAGVLRPEQAAPLLAAARGEVVTVRAGLRWLAGLSVALLTGAAGLLIRDYHDAIGPLGIALLLGLAAALALAFAFRRGAPFTWGRDPGPDWLLDGLVLLAVGLLGADLAWIEVHFTPFGAEWPYHLLAMSLLTGALAVRFDSAPAWSLALATFAAWRGVSIVPGAAALESALGRGDDPVRPQLLLCAALFFVLGRLAVRFGRKAHFEPATTFLALLAAALATSTALVSADWAIWNLTLATLGSTAAVWAFRARRRALFALGALALYVAMTRTLFALPFGPSLGCFWFAASTVGVIVLLVAVHRSFRAAEGA